MESKSFPELWARIYASFDFKKVHTAMTALKWRWWDGRGPDGVPDLSQLQNEACRLCADAYFAWHQLPPPQRYNQHLSCGGFSVRYDGQILQLEFVVEELAVDERGELCL